MKRACLAILWLMILASTMLPQSKSRPARKGQARSAASPEQSLKDAKHQCAEAFKNRDKAALLRILDDQFTFTDDEGQVISKSQYIDAASSAKIESISLEDVTVRIFGDTGVVAGRLTPRLTILGKDASGSFQFTDTFIRRNGRWRAVASQNTRVPPQQVVTASGLRYVDLVIGTGESPKKGQTVTVHYTGTFENGSKFDSSLDRGQPITFPIGMARVIKGWDEGLMSMKVGGKRKLIIPADLAYGAAGRGPIPPNSTLIFEVELLGIQ
jgi:FKBP-type peptidyl-prolyl isomerase-like protein/uncharacterized protein DUF4440